MHRVDKVVESSLPAFVDVSGLDCAFPAQAVILTTFSEIFQVCERNEWRHNLLLVSDGRLTIGRQQLVDESGKTIYEFSVTAFYSPFFEVSFELHAVIFSGAI